jgi:alpha-galactosidase
MNQFASFLFSVVIAQLTCASGGLAQDSSLKPIKAFILVGQSNMQGHAHVRTLSGFTDYVDDKNNPRVHEKVGITSLSSNGLRNGTLTSGFGASKEKIGPELSFGVNMNKLLDGEPILIIKAAWGGKSLHTDFRPPSAGPFVFSKHQLQRFEEQKKDVAKIRKEKVEATGHYYRLMMEHVKNVIDNPNKYSSLVAADQKIQLAGFVWFQGWNDMVDGNVYPERGQPGGYDSYSNLLAHFIRDVRSDLGESELPFVIGVMGVGGPTKDYRKDQQRHKATHQTFRDAMAAPSRMPEFKNSVRAVLTEEYWDSDLGRLVNRRDKINGQVRRKVKDGEIPRNRQQAEKEKLIKEQFSESEARQLELGVSNAAYHYLGSGKIMLGIGKGFAEAMLELSESRKQPSAVK